MLVALIIAAIIGLMILTGVKSKAVGNVAFGLVSVITYIFYGIFILAIAAFVIFGIWWAIDTYIL